MCSDSRLLYQPGYRIGVTHAQSQISYQDVQIQRPSITRSQKTLARSILFGFVGILS